LILQVFIDRHGHRLARDLKACDVTSWIDDQSGWKPEWARSSGLKYLKAPFSWAVK
jgi:hypothetical protein